jgi:hypothetical protein
LRKKQQLLEVGELSQALMPIFAASAWRLHERCELFSLNEMSNKVFSFLVNG